MIYRTGCSGWSYEFWRGKIYNYSEPPSNFLNVYSRIFDTVEIDSTFSAAQGQETVKKWYNSVPDNFLFSPKMPRKITHEEKLVKCEDDLVYFIKNISILGEKLGIILVQLPPNFTFNLTVLESFLEMLPNVIKYAVEFRHISWFRKEVYDMLKKYNVIMVWSVIDYLKTPEIKTTENLYVRFLGNKSLTKKELGELRINRHSEVIQWVERIKNHDSGNGTAFIYANNHYEGLSPDTIKFVRYRLGMPAPPPMVVDRQKKLF